MTEDRIESGVLCDGRGDDEPTVEEIVEDVAASAVEAAAEAVGEAL